MKRIPFLSGAVTMGSCAIALFSLRFWRTFRDPLFICFSLAFLLPGLPHGALTIGGGRLEERSPFYLPPGRVCPDHLRHHSEKPDHTLTKGQLHRH